MRHLVTFACLSALIQFVSTPATAVNYEDRYDYPSSPDLVVGPTHVWDFDLDNDVLNQGDINPSDTIDMATLEIDIHDIEPDIFPEYMSVVVDGITVADSVLATPIGEEDGSHSFDVLSAALDHNLEVSIASASGGDFEVDFVGVLGEYTPAPIPVPSLSFGGFTLLGGLVFGIAVAGLAVQRRRRAG